MSKAYPSNLTLNQFELLNDLIPEPKLGGRPREVDMWEIRERHFLYSLSRVSLAGFAWRLPRLADGVYLMSVTGVKMGLG
jgi:putative transposase